MNETTILQRIRLAVARIAGLRCFRNNCGKLLSKDGRVVTFGLHPGSADLIGWQSITITPDMVGKKIAKFVSIEVKTATGSVRPEQAQWLKVVNEAGGSAIIARNEDDVMRM